MESPDCSMGRKLREYWWVPLEYQGDAATADEFDVADVVLGIQPLVVGIKGQEVRRQEDLGHGPSFEEGLKVRLIPSECLESRGIQALFQLGIVQLVVPELAELVLTQVDPAKEAVARADQVMGPILAVTEVPVSVVEGLAEVTDSVITTLIFEPGDDIQPEQYTEVGGHPLV
jgi:hypothetical protein